MLHFIEVFDPSWIAFFGILFAFAATCFSIAKWNKYLPCDQGRQFAHDGALSAGKPRGAGLIFVIVFAVTALIFGKINLEMCIYLGLILVEMLTGFFDDAAEKPWGEYLKGFLDLVVSVIAAVVFLQYNENVVYFALFGQSVEIPKIVFGILTVVLIWAAINVTNCADGVDGLSATLVIISIVSIFVIDNMLGIEDNFNYSILLFSVVLLGYLWYNATPSRLLMGDAGSRAMGIFVALAVLKSGSPFLFLLVAAMIIIDGGLGLIKVFLLRFCKIHILKNTTTPIHDHVRKNKGWSNAQVVFRFAIIQIIISLATIYMVMLNQ